MFYFWLGIFQNHGSLPHLLHLFLAFLLEVMLGFLLIDFIAWMAVLLVFAYAKAFSLNSSLLTAMLTMFSTILPLLLKFLILISQGMITDAIVDECGHVALVVPVLAFKTASMFFTLLIFFHLT